MSAQEKTNLEKEIDFQKEKYAKMAQLESERQVKMRKKLKEQKDKIFDLMTLNEGVNKVFTNLDDEWKKRNAAEEEGNVHDFNQKAKAN